MISSKQSGLQKQVDITSGAYDMIVSAALDSYPEECCGVLIGSSEKSELIDDAISVANRTDAGISDRHFWIDPLELYRIEQEAADIGKRVIGFFHSHPDAEAVLSDEDERYMIPETACMIIPVYADRTDKARAYIRQFEDETIKEADICIKETTS